MPMAFPDKIASYYEYRNQMFGEETDARFFVRNNHKVMTARKHLPTYKEIMNDVATFNELYAGRFAKLDRRAVGLVLRLVRKTAPSWNPRSPSSRQG